MASLSSASSYEDVFACYTNNAGYEEDMSVPECRAFITACRFLLLLLPKRAAHANRSEEVEIDPSVIQAELRAAKVWLTINSAALSAARATFSDFTFFRDGYY
jgi:hypothetical protein